MSVDQPSVIDVVSVNADAGEVILTVSDHLSWSDSIRHQTMLQAKFNAYLAFVEGGEVYEKYPDAKGRKIIFRVVFKFRPNAEGVLFLARARKVIQSAGIDLRHQVLAESYGN